MSGFISTFRFLFFSFSFVFVFFCSFLSSPFVSFALFTFHFSLSNSFYSFFFYKTKPKQTKKTYQKKEKIFSTKKSECGKSKKSEDGKYFCNVYGENRESSQKSGM
ncbi:uncharacterized protein SOCG_05738 [Schizosaccharomyces octosporus yFS286]|uniref:Uncharacterized protein n=1 Tax=Schizosaccharomyces octosporus (strain yFS286) TaxID=483514 RepID=S9PV40_SCHOY|nr:uncharacterized protein SOCG_05738 [Schizosaccharomyces octosporus yFS286]EPX72971.1 hypothetical protein SOCG_05738 [Schizosaccharomyces octosporus yFS286]